MKKKNTMTKPQNNFVVRIGENSLSASSAQEALKLASIAINKPIATNELTDEDAVKVLWQMAKGQDGKKLIHSFSLPWNLKFQPSTMSLIRKDVEDGDKPNVVGTGKISKKTAEALTPSVVNSHTEQIESLTASLKEISAALKSQVELNSKFDARLTALETAVKQLQDAQKPLPTVTTKHTEPKASKKKTTSSYENTLALLFS